MTDERIWESICSAMAEEFELDQGQMRPDSKIKDDLGLDSLDIVDMVIVLENTFDFKIEDKTALKEIVTLADVADFIAGIIEVEKAKAANA